MATSHSKRQAIPVLGETFSVRPGEPVRYTHGDDCICRVCAPLRAARPAVVLTRRPAMDELVQVAVRRGDCIVGSHQLRARERRTHSARCEGAA